MSKPKKPRRSNTPPWATAAGYLSIGGVDDDLKWQITRKDPPVFERVEAVVGPGRAMLRLVPYGADLRVQAGNGTVRSYLVDDWEGTERIETDDLAIIALAEIADTLQKRLMVVALALRERRRLAGDGMGMAAVIDARERRRER